MSWRARLERHANRLWYETQTPGLAYRALERLYRRFAKQRFHRPSGRPPVPVIVVGNLCVGGAGKTPTVIALARRLAARYRVAIISRGYGGHSDNYPLAVGPETAIAEAGDEALLIAREAGVPVWVDPERSRALQAAIEDSAAEVVISDDGLQHQALARSFEICLFDGHRGLGNGHLLPAGPLRQPRSRLASVDLLLVKGAGFSLPGAEHFELEAIGFRDLDGSLTEPLEAWRGREVDAVCGIANPEGFADTLERLGLKVRLHAFPDHHRFLARDFAGLDRPVITTAKDAVRIEAGMLGLPLRVLEVLAALPESVYQRIESHIEEFA
ncbi:tetraacyldisaccharide 4'-kinase [Wenzhouxiangella marina]|uniref:Tetraacyldisaccharide 4'-kinase n=1 Tax=Wenzhouxiangella marina TaxID=1579979 RepID=A0A0K0XWW2_9GAMM|nr:tetraacyldisaccharide 4'-kinase [Wenzhouxiangella marina]AKS42189.1 Tetraacyldisaccharide 4'-kinase [Wenzhouxiangella marina]MBB6086039.1 tetraacyldisaccharide 4'-kinase [Wenzhouxiangella marina]